MSTQAAGATTLLQCLRGRRRPPSANADALPGIANTRLDTDLAAGLDESRGVERCDGDTPPRARRSVSSGVRGQNARRRRDAYALRRRRLLDRARRAMTRAAAPPRGRRKMICPCERRIKGSLVTVVDWPAAARDRTYSGSRLRLLYTVVVRTQRSGHARRFSDGLPRTRARRQADTKVSSWTKRSSARADEMTAPRGEATAR